MEKQTWSLDYRLSGVWAALAVAVAVTWFAASIVGFGVILGTW